MSGRRAPSGVLPPEAAEPAVADAARRLSRRRRLSRTAGWMTGANLIIGCGVWSGLSDTSTDVSTFPVAEDVTLIAVAVALLAVMTSAFIGWARCDKAVARIPPDVRDLAEAVVAYQRSNAFPVLGAAFGAALAALILAGFFFGVPMAVNGTTYLLRAGQTVTFTPESYNYSCDDQGDCTQVTQGMLGQGGSPTAYTWPHAVPLHHPFPVQLTFIRWPTAPRIYDDGDARDNLFVGLIPVVLGALLTLFLAWRVVRVTRRGYW